MVDPKAIRVVVKVNELKIKGAANLLQKYFGEDWIIGISSAVKEGFKTTIRLKKEERKNHASF